MHIPLVIIKQPNYMTGPYGTDGEYYCAIKAGWLGVCRKPVSPIMQWIMEPIDHGTILQSKYSVETIAAI